MSERSGSENRERSIQIGVRLSPDEAASLTEAARLAGVTLPALLRQSALAARAAAPDALRVAWAEGYEAARTMARCYGHTDHWEDEPENPYRGGQR